MRILALIAMVIPSIALTPVQQKQLDLKITIEGRKEHPIVYMTKEDIVRGRANREKYPWAKKAADALLAEADKWTGKSDEDLIKLIPPPKSCYAYGFAGCPVCGGTLTSWWGANGVASMDDPGHIKCVNGHRLPDADHPDAGDGYTDKRGKKFYFVGTYNSYIIDTLNAAMTHLVHAYALTGDTKYAHKSAVLLDNLARIYPTSETGSSDYPSNPASGRFNRPWYQVARTLVIYTNQYDILMMGDELNQPSSVAGMTRRQNIEQNMLLNGAAYCYRESVFDAALNNGEADYIRGPMAVGAAMGIKEYIDWGLNGPYSIRAMIANNVDRDGEYYETSAGYSDHARGLYMDMAEIVRHWTDASHPKGVDLSADPVFVSFNMLPRTRLRCATHPPSLGDDAPNIKRIATTEPTDRLDVNTLERLRDLTNDPKLIAETERVLTDFGDLEKTRAGFLTPEWLLFHARDVNASSSTAANQTAQTSELFAQKGLAILRSGEGENVRAATLRYGPTLNHGHLDEMNLNIFAQGYEMSYDLGYSLASTHTQVGWAHQTASHNTVVVDETPQLKSGRSGGTLESFTSAAGVTVVRANDPACYQSQGVKKFERTVAMIDVDDKLSYLVDVFQIEGGKKHDYFFHALGTDVTTDGLDLSSPAEGSLASTEIHWGDQIGSDGNVIGVLNKDYWNPPPQNGYGFLIHPQTANVIALPAVPQRTPEPHVSSVTWEIGSDHPAHLRLNMISLANEQITLAEAPGIYPKMPKAKYVVRSAKGLGPVTFVSVIEPYGAERAVKKISVQEVQEADAIALRVELADGRTDEIVWTPRSFRVERDKESQINITGDSVKGTIEKIDEEKGVLLARMENPLTDAIVGQFINVANQSYAQESPYRVTSVADAGNGLTAIGLAPTRFILGQGHLDTDPPDAQTLPNVIPIEYAKSVARKSSGFFKGKRIATPDGRVITRIKDFDDRGMTITVDSTKGFKAGDDLVIYDVSAGDSIRCPTFIRATGTKRGD